MKILAESRKFTIKHWAFIVFTTAYFLFSLLTYKDYGVTYDEKVEYDAGKYLITYYKNPTSIDYVKSLYDKRPVNIEQRHLPLFSVYSRIYPALVNVFNPNYYFEWFHLQNMIFGWFLFLSAYLLFYVHYKKGSKAIVAPIFLAFTPYLLGHIPANPKDIPFATIFLLGILGIYFFRTRTKNSYVEILSLGIIFGLAQSQRTVGLTLFMTYFFIGVFDLFRNKKFNFNTLREIILKSLLIFIVSLLIWVIALPFLGANFPQNFYEILVNAAGYAEWNHEIIYFGEYLTKAERPWHYLFVYLLIKLPLFSLLSILFGGFLFLSKKIRFQEEHPIFLLILICLLNFLIYLIIKPVVYNGIRHFLYLVVSVTLIAGFMFIETLENLKLKIKRSVLIVTVIYILFTVFRMIHLHPYEYIYFNELAGGLKGVSGNFDVEYWGAAYKEAAEYVRDYVTTNEIEDLKVYTCGNDSPVVYYSQFKYKLVRNAGDADIILCDLHKDGLRSYEELYPLIKTIDREGIPIFNIRENPLLED